jgi:formamidopyrimidine-DNA glycosylase
MSLMPELPDITAYLTALAARVLNQSLEHLRIASPLLLRTAVPPITSIEGQPVRALRRIGKRIVFCFDDDLFLVLHLMIAGRLHWRPLDNKPRPTLGGRSNLAAFDFPNGTLTLTEAGTKRRASLHLVRGEAARALTDPRILSGIGNAYSDEILHAAKLSPLAQTRKLTPEEFDRLYTATRTTLNDWVARFNAEAQLKFPEKVTAFRPDMAAHGRYLQPCPRCASPIQRIRYADNETNYCPTCQTHGKVLADRSLSRLIGSDWPRTLDELEALKEK